MRRYTLVLGPSHNPTLRRLPPNNRPIEQVGTSAPIFHPPRKAIEPWLRPKTNIPRTWGAPGAPQPYHLVQPPTAPRPPRAQQQVQIRLSYRSQRRLCMCAGEQSALAEGEEVGGGSARQDRPSSINEKSCLCVGPIPGKGLTGKIGSPPYGDVLHRGKLPTGLIRGSPCHAPRLHQPGLWLWS